MVQDQAVPPARTVCHACRGTAHTSVPDEDDVSMTRPVIVPGDGDVVTAIRTQYGDDSMVASPCPVCGESDDPGWLPGFVIPV
jgi:hypothetical protein